MKMILHRYCGFISHTNLSKCSDGDVQKFKYLDPRKPVRFFGMYGISGTGKTTMSQLLCNQVSKEFSGKVHHVELDNDPQMNWRSKLVDSLCTWSTGTTQAVKVFPSHTTERNRRSLKAAQIGCQDNTYISVFESSVSSLYSRISFLIQHDVRWGDDTMREIIAKRLELRSSIINS